MKNFLITITATQPIFISGTLKLVNDLTSWLMGLVVAFMILVFSWNLFKYFGADDNEKPKYIKNAKMTIIVGIAILLASVIIKLIVSYYK